MIEIDDTFFQFIPAPVKSLGKQSTSPNSQSKRRLPSVATTAAAVPSRSEFIPSFPVTHPPPHPPPGYNYSNEQLNCTFWLNK